jgi:KDO2-lipid IV(A) lauroyltransferase
MKLIARLPYPTLVRLGKAFGGLMYKLARSRTATARINIQRCFPQLSPQQQEQLVRDNLYSTGVGMLETAMLWFGPERDWAEMTEIVGLEHLQQAKQQGKGGLLLAFHLTSLEIGGCLLGKQFPIAALYRRNEHSYIESMMTQGRRRFVHPIPRENTREMVRWIKNNGFVWYAADQDYGRRQSIFVPFFNIPTATITATTRFVKLTGAPVIPMTQERIAGHKVRVRLHPPLKDMGRDERQDALTINQFLENYLKQHPTEYLWVHRRFKTRPSESDPSFYPKKMRARPVTPLRYKDILDAAEWVEYDQQQRPYRLKQGPNIIYFIYGRNLWPGQLKRQVTRFIQSHPQDEFQGSLYKYNGLIRPCTFKACKLIYFEQE